MSLEDALKANTEALKDLTAVMEARSGAGSPGAQKGKAAEKAAADKKPAAKKPAAGKGKAAPKVQRKDVTNVMLELANQFSRESAVAVLKDFGVKKASELSDDQLADAKGAFEQALKDAKAEAAAAENEDDDPLDEDDGDEDGDDDFDLD